MSPLLQVAIGGALGAVARYFLALQMARAFGTGFPWGTLAVNAVGCLAIGLALGALGPRFALSPLLITGFLGGFTTFSAFSAEVLVLFERPTPWLAAAYVGGTLAVTVAACGLGLWLGRALGP